MKSDWSDMDMSIETPSACKRAEARAAENGIHGASRRHAAETLKEFRRGCIASARAGLQRFLKRGWRGGLWTLAGTLLLACVFSGCRPAGKSEVVVYTSQDQVYSEPIFQRFARETGIQVRPVYDSEAVKTVGIANRLLAERGHPQCDVFWNNEELRTRQLAAAGVFARTPHWASVGYRTRRIVVNTNKLSLARAPRLLEALTNAVWRGKVALAYPLFGTTATHFLALRQAWGKTRWRRWCSALVKNKAFVVNGNSVVVQFVGRGEAWIGLTDSDDIAAGQREGYPIAALPITSETLLIPNTVAVVKGAPHRKAARRLWQFLQEPEVVKALIKAHALEGADPGGLSSRTLRVHWGALLKDLNAGTATLKQIFLQ